MKCNYIYLALYLSREIEKAIDTDIEINKSNSIRIPAKEVTPP